MKHLARPYFFSTACRRYGNVLLDLPDSMLNLILNELSAVTLWFQDRPSAWRLLCAVPPLSSGIQEIITSCKDAVGPWSMETENLLALLLKEHRMSMLSQLLAYVQEQKRSKETVYVTSATPLSDASVAELVTFFKTRHNSAVHIEQAHDPDLILGGIILWNNTLIDLSLKTKLLKTQQRICDEIFKTSTL